MTEAEKKKIREAIKNDAKLSQAYQQLVKAKQKGKLRKEINPDEIMVNLVAKYGTNAAGLVDAALSRPAIVMDTCKQKYSPTSGTLKYLTTGKTTDEQIASILNKTETQVKKDKAIKGTSLPASRVAVKSVQNESKVTRRIDERQVNTANTAVKSRPTQTKNKKQTNNKVKQIDSKTIRVNKPESAYKLPAHEWKNDTMDNLKALNAAERREKELQKLYADCQIPVIAGSIDLKTLVDKGFVTQKDVQAYYNKHPKELAAGMTAGPKGKELADRAYRHAHGNKCGGGCLGGVQQVNPDVPWGDDPLWDDVRRPGQKDNWGCDTYKILEKQGYITVAVENHSTGRESAGATRLRRTISGFPEGTTASFDNQIDYQVTNPQDYYGVIKAQTHPSKRCGHVATITPDGLCSDGFQSHNNGYDPTNYGKYVHLSLLDDTKVSKDLAEKLIAAAYDRRKREEAAKAKQKANAQGR